MSRFYIFCCILTGLLNPGTRDDDARATETKLQGRWIQSELTFYEPNSAIWKMIYGRELSTDNLADLFVNRAVLLVEGDRFTFRNHQHEKRVDVKLDPTKSPKAIDFLIDQEKPLLGVYEIRDGRLYLSIGDEKTRPESLSVQADQKRRFRIGFQRQRP